MTESLRIDVVSDVVCPWCYIGMKRLDRALAAVPDVTCHVNWRPFQLDGSIPPAGMDRKTYMTGKFGSEQRVRAAHERIAPLGAAEGIAFDFDAITVAPNTLDAHRLVRWSADRGPDVQHAVMAKLFGAYFEQGRNVGDRAVLGEVAREAGIDGTVVDALLAGDADRQAVEDEIATASRMGVTGVPCFLFEGRYAVMGAQDAETLADAIRQISAAKTRGELDDGPAASDPMP